MTKPLPIAVFLSGGGRTLQNLLKHRDQQQLPIDIRLVISSSSRVSGVPLAENAGLPTRVVLKSQYPDPDEYSQAMFQPCRDAGATWVVMAGYLKHVEVPADFSGRVVNIHPSLLPAFGGQGMFGQHVHQAAIDRGVQFSGCTVHLVDNQYDNGPILLQKLCKVEPGMTASELAAAVFQLECEALPQALRQLAQQQAAAGR